MPLFRSGEASVVFDDGRRYEGEVLFGIPHGNGVLIFAGLTAYYTQDIKNTYVAHAMHGDQEWLDKAAIDGALSLYISFLNMFQFLLMFMGQQE